MIDEINKSILYLCKHKQKSGKVFKLNELLQDTGMNNDSFKNTRKDNQTIKKLFDDMKTDKRGYYMIV